MMVAQIVIKFPLASNPLANFIFGLREESNKMNMFTNNIHQFFTSFPKKLMFVISIAFIFVINSRII
jgi:hypothetical protein